MTLGVQVQRSTPEAIAIVARSSIAKGVNNVDILTKAPTSAIRIYRHVFNSNDLTNPRRDADVILADLGTYRHPNLYVETQNELPKEKLTEYIGYLKLIVPMLHAAGLKVIGPSWATGDYEQGDWDAFRQAGWCGLDGISVHAYWAGAGFTPWNAFRWRTYYNVTRDRGLKVFVTECGRDIVRDGPNGSLVGQGGWKADGLSPEAYAAELNAYGAQLLPHEYATAFVSGGEPNWQNYDLDSLSHLIQTGGPPVVVAPPPKPTGGPPVIADYSSPNHGSLRARTNGIVIHATLSGKDITVEQEYQSTIGWFENPASQVSAHAIVGPGGKVHRSVKPELEAWHCRSSNATHLGLEMAKSHLNDVIEPLILDRAAQIIAAWCKQYAIPAVWSTVHGIEEHRRMPTNTDGHSDVGGPFDRADFLARVESYLKGVGAVTDVQKAAVLDDLGMIWGMSKADTIKANPAESERAIHERIAALKVTLGLQ